MGAYTTLFGLTFMNKTDKVKVSIISAKGTIQMTKSKVFRYFVLRKVQWWCVKSTLA